LEGHSSLQVRSSNLVLVRFSASCFKAFSNFVAIVTVRDEFKVRAIAINDAGMEVIYSICVTDSGFYPFQFLDSIVTRVALPKCRKANSK
jgi:hypothetical protein